MDLSDLESYDYKLPEELIRKRGVEPRDSARLFVYDTAENLVVHDTFANLSDHLPKGSLLVLNETRVVPARLVLRKETGGKIEVFVLANEIRNGEDTVPVLVDRKCVPGMRLSFPDGSYFEVVSQRENRFFVRPVSEMALGELLDRYGSTPIPHYLENGNEADEEMALRSRYQTVFANAGASVAAPTASLHFTEKVFDRLREKGAGAVRIGLDVGLGTFSPLRWEHFETGRLHREHVTVSAEAATRLSEAKRKGNAIVAVGTTALRTLETVVQTDESGVARFAAYEGETDIFIRPPHVFLSADMLITNFHLPKSSLMLLVEAFLRDKGADRSLVSLYEEAIRESYSFYSFGDSMLIR
ncbi:MAG: tRNA preQ1(34) S-adenosylmethionine ribosyltransferase-isomerase QueA [Candidatus Moranbacteria bacterium]|nr:tRNA preQ1(34) S-adenosylmethionine ribosyltransferase-isomerase QueA [Candidatus Moranbacteria bacterium]